MNALHIVTRYEGEEREKKDVYIMTPIMDRLS